MTARWDRRAVRLAWAIELFSLVLVIAILVLLALDWQTLDSPFATQLPVFIGALIVGILGVLIAARQPRNPIGWLLLATAVAGAISLLAYVVAIRGLLSGASPRSWVAWTAWVFTNTGTLIVILLVFVILLFPNGRLLPGPRWRWTAWAVFVVAVEAVASSMIALTPQDATLVGLTQAIPADRTRSHPDHAGIHAGYRWTLTGHPSRAGWRPPR
jgi:hypothetical protein